MEIAAEYNALAEADPDRWKGAGLKPRQDRFAGMSREERKRIIEEEAREYTRQFRD